MKELPAPGRMQGVNEKRLPTRTEAVWFEFRAACFRAKRGLQELNGRAPKRLRRLALATDSHLVAESRTVLYNSASPAEFALQAGKVQNLRVSARHLNGTIIPAGEVFSLWKNLGRATQRRGFVVGRELREGCVIPNIGGGLCQLSNALYDVALRAGCEIVERHSHTQALPGSTTAPGRDATIFWNYVDFRFRPKMDCQLRVELSRGELTVSLLSLFSGVVPPPESIVPAAASCETRLEVAETCENCGVIQCFRNPAASSLPRRGITAFLLDKFEPEFDRWVAENRDQGDIALVPLSSKRFPGRLIFLCANTHPPAARLNSAPPLTLPRLLAGAGHLLNVGKTTPRPNAERWKYSWNTEKFAGVFQSPLTTLRRSWRSRRLAAQGAARQRALLEFDRALALDFSSKIPHIADHLVVSQNLLPHLWRNGDLGGRTFDVLMTRLPMAELEKTLDAAVRMFPKSRTLADFRAPAEIRAAESEALAAARSWVTPHSLIAQLAGHRVVKLAWHLPAVSPRKSGGDAAVFPASTLARKGCYEMRQVARDCGRPVVIVGPVIETPDFWNGLEVTQASVDWMDRAAVVVLPAWVEHWPRRLLKAVAAGVPVIATTSCGLAGIPGVTEVSPGDVDSLGEKIREAMARNGVPVESIRAVSLSPPLTLSPRP